MLVFVGCQVVRRSSLLVLYCACLLVLYCALYSTLVLSCPGFVLSRPGLSCLVLSCQNDTLIIMNVKERLHSCLVLSSLCCLALRCVVLCSVVLSYRAFSSCRVVLSCLVFLLFLLSFAFPCLICFVLFVCFFVFVLSRLSCLSCRIVCRVSCGCLQTS